jgi:hypothetical protein
MTQRKIISHCLVISSLFCVCAFAWPGQGANQLTPDQGENVHSRLFQKGSVGQIPDMLSRGSGDVYLACVVGISQRVHVERSLPEELGLMASDSDLVVLGKVGTGTTHTTADKDWLYTDWNFAVEEVLKDNPKASVHPGATILVTRPGGKLQVNGRMVYATCSDFQEFASGPEYLLYLRFIPETGAYVAGGSGAFAFSPVPRRLDSVHYRELAGPDEGALLKAARDGLAISVKSPRGSGGGRNETSRQTRDSCIYGIRWRCCFCNEVDPQSFSAEWMPSPQIYELSIPLGTGYQHSA